MKEKEKDGRLPAAQGRAGDPSDLSRSASQPSGLPSLTHELSTALRNYARWTREAQERGPHHPDSISIDDMDAEMLEGAADEIDRLRAVLMVVDDFAVLIGRGKTFKEYAIPCFILERIEEALRVSDGSPKGRDAKQLDGEATTARPRDSEGRP